MWIFVWEAGWKALAAGSLLYQGLSPHKGEARMPEPLPESPAATALAAKILHVLWGHGH